GTDRHVEDRRQPLPRSQHRFGEAGDIRIVADHGGDAKLFPEPLRQWEAVPAGNVMGLDHGLSGVVGGAAEADADAAELFATYSGIGQQFGNGGDNRLAYPVAARRRIHGPTPQAKEPAVALAQAELQFRAADFNSEIHRHAALCGHFSAFRLCWFYRLNRLGRNGNLSRSHEMVDAGSIPRNYEGVPANELVASSG